MNEEEMQVQHTQHAFLVAWSWFGEHIGLIQALPEGTSSSKTLHAHATDESAGVFSGQFVRGEAFA